MNVSISVQGLSNVQDMLEGLEEAILDAAEEGMAEGIEMIAATARALAPVESGGLRGSIFGQVHRGGGSVAGSVTASAPHAMYVEMGTSNTPAQPFLHPAFAMGREQLLEAVAARVRGVINI